MQTLSFPLPPGALTVTINGKQCFAIPRTTTSRSAAVTTPANRPTSTSHAANEAKTTSSSTHAGNTPVDLPTTPPHSSSTASSTAGSSNSSEKPPPLPPPPLSTSFSSTSTTAGTTTTIRLTSALSNQVAAQPKSAAAGSVSTTSGPLPAAAPTASRNATLGASTVSHQQSVQSTVAVTGGVIGAVVGLSLIAFLVWWYRRRMLKRRRSSLLTALTTKQGYGGAEKGSYVISRASNGPTRVSDKFMSAVRNNMSRLRAVVGGNKPSPRVSLNRADSRSMDQQPSTGFKSSFETDLTFRDRLCDWWIRLKADINFNWRVRGNNKAWRHDALARDVSSRLGSSSKHHTRPFKSPPDFLALMKMDDQALDRVTQQRRQSERRQNGSASSTDHFLGGLDKGHLDDPFSDLNALLHDTPKTAPIPPRSTVGNPFADASAVVDAAAAPRGTNYVADMRRSRGRSVGGATWRKPSTFYGGRESNYSVESFDTRRNKFRSDPFDLERPELLGTNRKADSCEVVPPGAAHTRSASMSINYSSGLSGVLSMSDWSDPGPDVGPSSTRPDKSRDSLIKGRRDRQEQD